MSSDPQVRAALAKALRELRVERGLGSQEAAKALGTCRAQIHRWESGQSSPSSSHLIELAALYDADVQALVAPALAKARVALGKPQTKGGAHARKSES